MMKYLLTSRFESGTHPVAGPWINVAVAFGFVPGGHTVDLVC